MLFWQGFFSTKTEYVSETLELNWVFFQIFPKPRKRKRRHRDAYYNDDNGESESESDSEIEPAPAGGESSKEGNQNAPKVEAISSDDVVSEVKEAGEEVKTVDEKINDEGLEKKPSENEQPGGEIPCNDVTEMKSEVAESGLTGDMIDKPGVRHLTSYTTCG